MKKAVFIACSSVLLLQFGCSNLPENKDDKIQAQLQYILDSTYAAHPEAVGILVHVEAPNQNTSWTGMAGHASKQAKDVLHVNTPVLIASNTKTYVAAAVLKLVELGKFALEDSIGHLIQFSTANLLRKDGYTTDQITVRHLLSHTSGIADYVDSDYFDLINQQPQHQWTRDEQIARAVQMADPLAKPGLEFSYADLNYLLLTEVIEGQTDMPLYTAIRQLLNFKEHGLNNTWFISLEEAPDEALPLAHQYWEHYDWDSYELNPSWDLYGGGGIVANAKDMALFFQLLFEGQIIEDALLLAQMNSYVLPAEKSNYCLGLRKLSFYGFTADYHGGFWGTDVLYFPENQLSISAVTLQKDARDLNEQLSADILRVLGVKKPQHTPLEE